LHEDIATAIDRLADVAERAVFDGHLIMVADRVWITPAQAADMVNRAAGTIRDKCRAAHNAAAGEEEFKVTIKGREVRARVAGGGESRKYFELIRTDITGGPSPREILKALADVRAVAAKVRKA